tara:strand:- start:638 stop:1363 length:726 start_codon:yes stop_codon:yes gene_type:complete
VATFKLPFPEETTTGTNIAYNEELAKEQEIVAKIFTETGNLFSNLLNLPGRFIKDTFQSMSGYDLGRRPMDVTELSFIKAEKRKYSFNWVFTSISYAQSLAMVNMASALTAFSLPSSAGYSGAGGSTRMIMPHMWTMEVIDSASAPGPLSLPGRISASNTAFSTIAFLEQPKTCFLTKVAVDRDTSAIMRSPGAKAPMPVTFALSLDFTEIDPILRDPTGKFSSEVISRSELRSGARTYQP